MDIRSIAGPVDSHVFPHLKVEQARPRCWGQLNKRNDRFDVIAQQVEPARFRERLYKLPSIAADIGSCRHCQ